MHEMRLASTRTRDHVLHREIFLWWRDLTIHESSPVSGRGASRRLKNEAPGYVPSHYYPNAAAGEIVNGVRCEDLENLSFDDESFDLHLAQDCL